MSVSLYRWTEACEGRPCPGDCDLCAWEPETDEEEEPTQTNAPNVLKALEKED